MRRLGMLVGVPAAVAAALVIGFVIGSNTSYALAEVPGARLHPPTATAMIRNALTVLTCGTLATVPPAASAQQGIPLVNLPPASVRTTGSFGAILGLKQSPDGKVLVNDAGRHLLKLYDTLLTTSTIVLDSTPGTSNSYGARPVPMNGYLGDSLLIADWNSRTMLVLDSHGQLAHALALPNPNNFGSVANGYVGVDAKGRLVFRTGRMTIKSQTPRDVAYSDSVAILRADLDLRRVDTVGRVARPLMKVISERGTDGRTWTVFTADPLQPVDDWAVLSNGAVAFVRGHDYRVDWINPDGTMSTSPKMPFEWKRLDDAEKQRLNDSLRTTQNTLLAAGYPQGAEVVIRQGGPCEAPSLPPSGDGGGARAARSGGSGEPPAGGGDCTMMNMNGMPTSLQGLPGLLALPPRGPMPPLADLTRWSPIADYLPPFQGNVLLADADNNLWILPRTSALSKNGELVYDVVNARGELFQRVRMPVGRAIAGFAKGGVVYMTSGDRTNGFYLERTRLPRASTP